MNNIKIAKHLIKIADELIKQKDLTSAENLCSHLLSFQFNIVDYTKYPKTKSSGTSDDDFIKIYRLQYPEDTLHFKCGTCWDISYCAIVELRKSGYDATPYWYEVTGNETHPNHMFIIITINDQYYIFEASMSSHGGIHGPFNSLNDIFKKYIQWQIKTGDVGDSIIFHQITKYPLPGTSYDEFFQQVRKSPIISKLSF